jgi:hypothetical protein
MKRFSAYVGRQQGNPVYVSGDPYISEGDAFSQYYQLEPSLVLRSRQTGVADQYRIENASTYLDLLNKLTTEGGLVSNHDRLFGQQYYNYQGFANLEKLINYSQYYWIPNGPDPVDVFAGAADIVNDYTVTLEGNKTQDNLTSSLINQIGQQLTGHEDLNPTLTLVRGGSYTFRVDQPGLPFYIQTHYEDLANSIDAEGFQNNYSRRDVYGVKNNGATSGTVTFNVPSKSSQDKFINMAQLSPVDLVLDIPFSEIQNSPLDLFNSKYKLDGILATGSMLKRVTFTDTNDDNWISNSNFESEDFDNLSFDQGTPIPQEQRKGVWQMNISSGIIRLTYIQDWPANYKAFVNEGIQYGSRYLYKDATGTFRIVPHITSNLDTLYYQTANYGYGIIRLIEHDLSTVLDVEKNILGQKTYISPNGIRFTNGLKVRFTNLITPAKYAQGEWIVEGVGKSIRLVNWRSLVTPEPFTELLGSGYDAQYEYFDTTNYDGTLNSPANKDYIVADRSSPDGNPWSRTNRWFHKDLLSFVAGILTPGIAYPFDETQRAKRPIVEFVPDLYLFDGADSYYGPVDLASKKEYNDSSIIESDALSDVEGTKNYFVDGVGLDNGMTVIFMDDPKTWQTVYRVQKIDVSGSGNYQIHLDPIHTMSPGESVVLVSGKNKQGIWYCFDGVSLGWRRCQQKIGLNVSPYFDIVDSNGTSLGDKGTYISSTFQGSQLFNYAQGMGVLRDSELGFPLVYRTIGNIGDIQFNNFYDQDQFTYSLSGKDTTLSINIGNVRTLAGSGLLPRNPWVLIADPSKQFIEKNFIATLNTPNNFRMDLVFQYSAYEKNVFVTVNGISRSDFNVLVDSNNKYTVLQFANDLAVNDQINVKIYGTSSSRQFYTVPRNLEKNGQNNVFQNVTLGQMRNHMIEMTRNSLAFSGNPIGSNNLRDIDFEASPGNILQHSAPVYFAQFLNNNPATDIIKSLDFNRRAYSRFKDQFLHLLATTDFRDQKDPVKVVDDVMLQITAGSDSSRPFFYTDMIPFGGNYVDSSYRIFDIYGKTFNAINSYGFNLSYDASQAPYRAILVYRKRGNTTTQLVIGQDYTVTRRLVQLSNSFDLALDDVIVLREYADTTGCMIPATPTKLGMYPRFLPTIYLDDTYLDPVEVIQGHDGSIMPAFGDFRDTAILEFEKRIYNNIRSDWLTTLSYYQTVEPTAFRDTGYSIDEWTQVLSASFMEWVGYNALDPFSNNTVNDSLFSLNYAQGSDKLTKQTVPGYWRGIYNYFYETDRPHVAPWEIAGYSVKPEYWDIKYGPAPYSSGNAVMWGDLEAGIYYTDDAGNGTYTTAVADPLYAKPGLSSIIPVDEHGNLLPPRQSIIDQYDELTANGRWRFGDQGPVETAWRKSSEYPFAVMKAYSLTRPVEFAAFAYNVRDYVQVGDQIYNRLYNNRKIAIDVSGDGINIPGTNVWIRDRMASLGLDVTTNLIDTFSDLRINLAYKIAGYTDMNYIQVMAEQSSPQSKNQGVLIPQDNYNIVLTKSAPAGRYSYSAVVINRTDRGYVVQGFDSNSPYFTIIPSLITGSNSKITVGNSAATIYTQGDTNRLLVIPYGTVFTNKQQVCDFLISYGRYLTTVGFQFIDTLDDGLTRKDWTLSCKEFLFWTDQNWGQEVILSVTPASGTIRFDNGVSVVDDLSNSYIGTRIIDSSNQVVNNKNYRIFRDGTAFEIKLRDSSKGIHLLDIETVQYEHTLVFDNTTVFNDVIYDTTIGNRQQRLKLVGRKTAGWNGSIYAPGFMINHRPVDSWMPWTDYFKGDIVTVKGKYFTASDFLPGSARFNQNKWYEVNSTLLDRKLIPNATFNASQFEEFYDVDTQDVNTNADLQARHATGFQPRQYMTDLGMDIVSQHKFYLGMIAEKGTQAAMNKFLRAKLPYIANDITIKEEWAFIGGSYGNTENRNTIELPLNKIQLNNDIAVIELLDKNDARDNRWNTFKTTDMLWVPDSYNKNLFSKTANNNPILPSTGPVLQNEVAATVFDVNKIEKISPLARYLGEGSLIWVASDIDDDWNIYRCSNDREVLLTNVSKPSSTELEFTTNKPHGLVLRDKVLVKNATITTAGTGGISTTVDMSGVYRITAYGEKRFRVNIPDQAQNIATGTIRGLLFKLESVRFSTRTEFGKKQLYRGWKKNDRVYIDNVEGAWQVLENRDPWTYSDQISPVNLSAGAQLGTAMVMTPDQTQMVINSQEGQGKAYVYSLDTSGSGTWSSTDSIVPQDSYAANFAQSMCVSANGILAIGSPGFNGGQGAVYIMDLNVGTAEFKQIIYPSTLGSNDQFGYSVTTNGGSIDSSGYYLAISALGSGNVYLYLLDNNDTQTTSFIGNGVNTQFVKPTSRSPSIDQLRVTVNNQLMVPHLDYTESSDRFSIIMTTAPAAGVSVEVSYGQHYNLIQTITNPGSNNSFGWKISMDVGNKLIVTAPTEINAYSIGNLSTGSVYVYEPRIDNFIADGVTNSFVSSVSSMNLTRPSVLVDEVRLVRDTDFSVTGSTINLVQTPSADSVVSIESRYFTLFTKLLPPAADASNNQRFGADALIYPKDTAIFVGAPGTVTASGDLGAVYRFVNIGKLYGQLTGTIANPTVTVGDSFKVENFNITMTGTTLSNVINDINNAKIPGVTASSYNGYLRINSDKNVQFFRLRISVLSGTVLTDLGLNLYPSVQRIDSIYQENGLNFGEHLAIDTAGTSLMIGTTKASTVIDNTFDKGLTTFDGDIMRLKSSTARTGAAYLYEYQSSATETETDVGQFAYAKGFTGGDYGNNFSLGASMVAGSRYIMIAAPNGIVNNQVAGFFHVYSNLAGNKVWEVLREQSPDVDSSRIKRAFIYNQKTNSVVAEIPVVDTAYGQNMPDASKFLDYVTNYDPAVYNHVPALWNFTYDKRTAWGKEHVGQLWWDTNSVKLLDWKQGDLIDKANRRDGYFPSSLINVYEWIESNISPAQFNKIYSQFGIKSLYTVNEVYTHESLNDGSGAATNKYYFWVQTNNSVSNPTGNSKISQITQGLSNPRTLNMPFLSLVAPNALALYNSSDMLGNDYVLKIEFDKNDQHLPDHVEWSIFDDGSTLGFSQSIYDKLLDSLAAQDAQGRIVPDPRLADHQKYGIGIRPRQSVFADPYAARYYFYVYANDFFQLYPMRLIRNLDEFNSFEAYPDRTQYVEVVDTDIELSYLEPVRFLGQTVLVKQDSINNGGWTLRQMQQKRRSGETIYDWQVMRVQTWDNRNFWSYADWYGPEFNQGQQTSYQVDFSFELTNLKLKNGDTIRIANGSNGGWQIVKIKNNSIELVAEQNATIQIDPGFYKGKLLGLGWESQSFESGGFGRDNNIETRQLFNAMVNLFLQSTGAFVKEFRTAGKAMFQQGIQIINMQFKEADWIFKTSYISIDHTIRNLDQIPIYVQSPENIVQDYISEIKPYHAKIRKYNSKYPGSDTASIYTADFDLPPYLASDTGLYRSPQLSNPVDQYQLSQYPWAAWTKNKGYQLEYISIIDGGTGYTNDSVVMINSDSGTGATAKISVREGGVIDQVMLLTPGDGYLSTPQITVIGQGSGAVLAARLVNTKIRSFKSTIVFDRFTYDTTMTEWQPSHSYSVGDVFIYDYSPWRVIAAFTSGTDIDLSNVVPYKSYRWEPLTRYQTGDILITDWANRVAYEVLQPFTTSDRVVIDPLYLRIYTGTVIDNASDRIWAHYSPAAGQAGKDLAQLMKGIEYPGVQVVGPNFNKEPGFDVNIFDDESWDNYTTSANGVSNISSIDTNYSSRFEDLNLGLRPEDIITAGGAFIDTYSSHAPEELVPGMVYDALDIKVTTLPGTDGNKGSFGPDMRITGKTAGTDTNFPFNGEVIGGVEKVVVYTKNTQFKTESLDFTIDYVNNIVNFNAPLSDPEDIVYVLAIGSTGENILQDSKFVGDGEKTVFVLENIRASKGKQLYVKLDGAKAMGYTITWDPARVAAWTQFTVYKVGQLVSYLGTVYRADTDIVTTTVFDPSQFTLYDYELTVVFDQPPQLGSLLQIHSYDEDPSRRAYSSIVETDYIVPTTSLSGVPVAFPDGYVFTLNDRMLYKQPWLGNISVRLRGSEIAPANNHYFTGDGTTQNYIVPLVTTTANNYSPTDIAVVVDGVFKQQYVDYTLDLSGTSRQITVQFLTAPSNGSSIILSDSSTADYKMIDDQTLIIKDVLNIENGAPTNLSAGDKVTVVQYSNYDMYDMRTQVFKGLLTTTSSTGGFDVYGFGATGFDSIAVSIVSNPSYQLSRKVGNTAFLQVFLNGAQLENAFGYNLDINGLLNLNNNLGITSNDVIHIRHFSENTRNADLKFRYFKDMTDKHSFYGIGRTASTVLTQPLNIDDSFIHLQDTSGLNSPGIEINQPGILFINGERISYWYKDDATNTIGRIRRATGGTGAPAVHPAGSFVEDGSQGMLVPNGDVLWYNLVPGGSGGHVLTDGKALQDASTPQVAYLKSISR